MNVPCRYSTGKEIKICIDKSVTIVPSSMSIIATQILVREKNGSFHSI